MVRTSEALQKYTSADSSSVNTVARAVHQSTNRMANHAVLQCRPHIEETGTAIGLQEGPRILGVIGARAVNERPRSRVSVTAKTAPFSGPVSDFVFWSVRLDLLHQ